MSEKENSDNCRGKSDDEEREEKVIDDNIDFIDEFLNNIKSRGSKIPTESKKKLDKFKAEWSKFFTEEEEEAVEAKDVKYKGARPKVKPKPSTILKDSDSYSAESESEPLKDGSGGGSDLAGTSSRKKKGIGSKEKNDDSTIDKLVHVMSKFDTRQVPSIERFDEDSGEKLDKYLIRFERYCEINFKGDRTFWIGELERKVGEGKTLEAFQAVRDSGDTYDELKEKLLEWNANFEEIRKKKNKQKFQRATYVKNESLSLYCSRLERLFRLAYPSKDIQTSKTLLDKYCDTIPKKMRKLLKSRICDHKYLDEKVKWAMIKKWARTQDVERDLEEDEDEVEDKEIIISIGSEINNTRRYQEKKTKDVSTQYSTIEFKPFTGKVYVPEEYSPAYEPRQVGYNRRSENQWRGGGRGQWSYGGGNRYPRFNRPSEQLRQRSVTCYHCGKWGHVQRDCNERRSECFVCGSVDHFARDCPHNTYYQQSSNHTAAQPLSSARAPSSSSDHGRQPNGDANRGNNDNQQSGYLNDPALGQRRVNQSKGD